MNEKQLEQKRKRFLAKHDGTNPLESKIEANWNKYANKHGWIMRKFKSPQNNAVPDRIYFRAGVCFLIEFKRKGKKPTDLQAIEHKVMREKGGMKVFVVDAIDKDLAELTFL